MIQKLQKNSKKQNKYKKHCGVDCSGQVIQKLQKKIQKAKQIQNLVGERVDRSGQDVGHQLLRPPWEILSPAPQVMIIMINPPYFKGPFSSNWVRLTQKEYQNMMLTKNAWEI